MALQFAFLFLVLVASVQSQIAGCNSTTITSCGDCLALNQQQNPQLSCGWCGATQTCLPKDASRQPIGQNCFGLTWEPEVCTDCTTLTDCRSCNAHPGDCSYCGNPPACRTRTLGCQVAPCSCDQYDDDCAGCLSDPGCNFCAGDNTCKAATDTTCVDKYTPAQGCPCSHNVECDSCRAQAGCGWCASGECQPLSNLTATCMLSMNCNAYCKQRGPSCNNCTALSGCSWCDDTSTCVDSSIQSSCFLTHQCPPSCDHKYCDTCLDAGCTWCRDSRKCMSLNQAKNSSCMSALSCPSFCQGYSSCGDCNQVLGCAWCGDSNTCVDKDKASTCMFALTCDPVPLNPTCPSFNGGSFVGGMFLVIGLLVVIVAAFAFYRWYTGKKILYTQLR